MGPRATIERVRGSGAAVLHAPARGRAAIVGLRFRTRRRASAEGSLGGLARLAAAVAVVAALGAAACAPRVPVVTEPLFPELLYPDVPAEYARSPLAGRHRDAWAFLQSGNADAAAERFAIVAARDAAFYPAVAGLGWANVVRGAYADAVANFETVIATQPAYLPALVGRGEAFLRDENAPAALRSFEAALAVDPGLGRVERVIEELRFAVSTERAALAEAAAARGDWAAAAAAYRELLEASPDSPFLYTELAQARLGLRDLDGALESARRATALDPGNGPALVMEGEILEARGDLAAAEAAFLRADTVDPSDRTATHLARVRELRRLASLPAEYRAIGARDAVTRADLAALLGVEFEPLLEEAVLGEAVPIITDTREHWSRPWILAVTRARVMAVDAAYRFEPYRIVRRGELAEAVAGMLFLIAEIDPAGAEMWRVGAPRIADMNETHLNYASVVEAVSAGVLSTFTDGTFQPTRSVSGTEAVEAVDRLGELLRDAG